MSDRERLPPVKEKGEPGGGRRHWGLGSALGAEHAADDHRLVELAASVRRALQRRTSDRHLIEDITQETMVRVAAARPQLEPGALRAYAIVTARNILVAHHRSENVAKRHAHRVVDYTTLSGAEELTLEREETNALARALEALDEADRRILLDHESNDLSVATLAARDGTTAGAMAMRLARSRALLRLEFLLAFRRVTLPTDHCRQVLLSMSAGDQRRQRALGASDHLITCDTCAQLSEPLVERRRGAAAWWILPIPAWVRRGTRRFRNSRTVQAATLAGVVGVLLLVGYLVATIGSPPENPATASSADSRPGPSSDGAITDASPSTTVAGTTATGPGSIPPASSPGALSTTAAISATSTPEVITSVTVGATSHAGSTTVPLDTSRATTTTSAPRSSSGSALVCPPLESAAQTTPVPGCAYVLADLNVTEVPADEGFWVTYTDGAPMWVHLEGTGESPERIQPGSTITITATITTVAGTPDTGAPPSQIDRVAARGIYLAVQYADLTVTG